MKAEIKAARISQRESEKMPRRSRGNCNSHAIPISPVVLRARLRISYEPHIILRRRRNFFIVRKRIFFTRVTQTRQTYAVSRMKDALRMMLRMLIAIDRQRVERKNVCNFNERQSRR